MPSWDPTMYGRFALERARPFADLLARVGAGDAHGRPDGVHLEPRTVVDLGCGPGDLTASLARRWPTAQVIGVDSSPQMLERADALDDLAGRLTFEQADASTWEPDAPVDVIVTNALLQWVPGHLDLLQRWMTYLAPGGWFAMQVPGNFSAISHRAMRDLTADPRFFDRVAGVLRGTESVAETSTYARLLAETGATVDAWETTYLHVLTGPDPVFTWVSGTGARPTLQALPDDLRPRFEEEFKRRLQAAYPEREGRVVLPFRRVFVVARVPA